MIGAGLTQGWTAVTCAYSAVQLPMLIGLLRGRAQFHSYLLSPLVAAPLTAIAAAGVTLASPLLGLEHQGLMQLTLGAVVSVYLGYTGGRVAARGRPNAATHERGSFVDHSAPARAKASSKGRHAQITLAGVAVPAQDETKHFKLIGTTGTGKSTAIREILHSALARSDRAVIADPDGGYMQRFYDPGRGDIVLNPFDERSLKWDVFAELESDYDVDQLALSLIPDHEGPDRSWRGYARTFLAAVTRQSREAGINDVAELYRLMVVADANELRPLVQGTPAQPFLEKDNTRMFDSIRSVTSSAVGALGYIARQKSRGFSVRQWVKQETPGVLFMPYQAGQIAALRSTISGWMRLAIFEAMNHAPDPEGPGQRRRLWFVVDELDALGQIDGLKDALARLRKFGGRCILGFQSIAQVSSTYGRDAHTIVENCGNTLILRCSASEGGGTARFASQLIGEREVMRTTVSRSRRATEFLGSTTHSEHLSTESAVLPSQIEQLPDLFGYLKHASDPRWHQVRLDAKHAWERIRPDDRSMRPADRHRTSDTFRGMNRE
jgi:type IV secretory pathway TraG/TraD family ATPase VirD4